MLIEFATFIATLLGIVILIDTIHTVSTRYERSIEKPKEKYYHDRIRRN